MRLEAKEWLARLFDKVEALILASQHLDVLGLTGGHRTKHLAFLQEIRKDLGLRDL